MKAINAQDVLDIAMAGTSATLLAKRWESALLVNVDNDTLQRLINNKDALDALMRIEGFRSLNQDIETIINKSEAVKKAKKEGTDKLTPKEKKELTDEEKEYKSLRKQIQEKLLGHFLQTVFISSRHSCIKLHYPYLPLMCCSLREKHCFLILSVSVISVSPLPTFVPD